MPPQSPVADLAAQLEELAAAIESLEVAPPGVGHDPVAGRDRVVRTIRSYLIPRIRDPRRPLLVVFAGPTGAGKSTLLNSVAGLELSRTGSLRPTTNTPVVFAAQGRTRGYSRIGGVSCRVVAGNARILSDLTLVDTPDIDSTNVEHRGQAEALIDSADVVIFVTSALRYADRVPWEVLRRAESRGAPIISVLNRIRSSSEGALADYRRLLWRERLAAELIPVHEQHMASGRQMVPAAAIKALRSVMITLVEDHKTERSDTFRSVVRATVDQAVDVVNHAEKRSEEMASLNSRLDALLSPSVDRLGISLQTHHLRYPDPETLGSINGSSRRKIRRYLSKNGPSPADTREVVRSIGNLVTGRVEADIRRGLAELVGPDYSAPTPMTTHRSVAGAVHNWLTSMEAGLVDLRAPFRETALLLLLAFSLEERPSWGRALETVAPSLNGYALRTGARWRLEADLSGVYETVRLRIRQSIGVQASSSEEIRHARSAVTALTARKSLTYV